LPLSDRRSAAPAVLFLPHGNLGWNDVYINIPRTAVNEDFVMITLSDLTSRELEILELVLAGYTNKAISAAMLISEKTVEYHLDRIYTKTGVRTRLLVSIWALQQGIGVATREIPN
jgi:DNA-binding NarL/FixJ family response regulator